jgi:hypothetical protein
LSTRMSSRRVFNGTPKVCKSTPPNPPPPIPPLSLTITATLSTVHPVPLHDLGIYVAATDTSRLPGDMIPTDVYINPPTTLTSATPVLNGTQVGTWWADATTPGTTYTITAILTDAIGGQAVRHTTVTI